MNDLEHMSLGTFHPAPADVASEMQGKGIGAQMLQHLCDLCPDGWSLHVATANMRARRFYTRCGLIEGSEDVHPLTGRSRIRCVWQPPRD